MAGHSAALKAGMGVVLVLGIAIAQQASPPQENRLSWLNLGGEFRARTEWADHLNFASGTHNRFYLNRLRLSAAITLRPWLQVFVEGQDARVANFSGSIGLDGLENHADFRQANVTLGAPAGRWELRLGRQELAFGDERLVGADSFWDPLGFTWDAARLSYRQGGVRLDWFASWRVAPHRRSLDRLSSLDRLHGFYAALPKGPRGIQVEPYFFFDEAMRQGRTADRWIANRICTPGARIFGELPRRFDYNVEMALERGSSGGESVSAWAGHWGLGYRLGKDDRSPRANIEYNFATGDGQPGDGRHRTFDDLHPAGFNNFGTADPFAWRNIRNLSGNLEWKPAAHWRLAVGLRSFSLASRADGLYTVGEEYLAWNPAASSSDVGRQALTSVSFEAVTHWQLHLGYARFFPGIYLKESGFHGHASTPFLMMVYRL